MAAAITEKTRKPRMIQSAMLMVHSVRILWHEHTRAKSPTRDPSTDDTPRGTFRLSATQLLGEGQAPAVVCSSGFLRGSPLHTACHRNSALCPVDRCRPARSARNRVLRLHPPG